MTQAASFYTDVADAPPGAEAFWLSASDGVRLRAVVWRGGARGTVVIFPGRTEFAEKYGRVARGFVTRGFAVVVIDWRGQGLSDRHPRSPLLGHVRDFRDYQRDVVALMALEAEIALPAPHYLVAHSMGGCIGLRTLLERRDFCGAIFSAPMWHLQMRAATREITTRMTRLAGVMGLGTRLMPLAGGRPITLPDAFAHNALTSDRETFAWCVAQIDRHPELALGGPSIQWTCAALEEMARLYVGPLPRLPMLVMVGSEETVVSAGVIRSQTVRMQHGEFHELSQARHEIFMERPDIVAEVWRRIDAFLGAAPSRRGLLAAAGG